MKKFLLTILCAIWGIIGGILLMEIMLRLAGYTTSEPVIRDNARPYTFVAPYTADAVTGWRLTPGTFDLTVRDSIHPLHVTILSDESRSTHSALDNASNNEPKILFIGDSYIFGDRLEDKDTLPWQVQQRNQNRKIINHGVSGYGTCQAFYRLQQITTSLDIAHSIVIYGLNGFHEERNTADPRFDYWVAMLTPTHTSFYPQCDLEGSEIVRKDPTVWNELIPYPDLFVVSKFTTELYLSKLALPRQQKQRAVTEALLIKINNFVQERGGTFTVLLQDLSDSNVKSYKNFLHQKNIPFIDGTEVARHSELRLSDGHPGSEMNQRWAKLITDSLQNS